jgi:hypothetical protein
MITVTVTANLNVTVTVSDGHGVPQPQPRPSVPAPQPSVPAPQPWKGTSATWQSIKALSLNNTVDIVTLIKNYDLFSSTLVSEDDLESYALEIFQAEAAHDSFPLVSIARSLSFLKCC